MRDTDCVGAALNASGISDVKRQPKSGLCRFGRKNRAAMEQVDVSAGSY